MQLAIYLQYSLYLSNRNKCPFILSLYRLFVQYIQLTYHIKDSSKWLKRVVDI